MEYQQRVDEIAALVAGVAGAGVVHNRTRLAGSWEDYLKKFKDAAIDRINGWEVTRKGPVEIRPPDAIETYVLRKYHGIADADATDHTFQAHLDAVIRLFRDTHNLSFGSVPIGLRVITIDERSFGGVLVHFAECELGVVSDYDTF